MAQDFSFDVVSKIDMQEVVNAVAQATKEMDNRFDFKGSKVSIKLDEKEATITIAGDDELKLRNILDILEAKLIKRGLSLKSLEYGKHEPAAGGTLRQVITLLQGVNPEKAKVITKALRDAKIKVNAQIQGDQIRVAAPKKDDLQTAITFLKQEDFGVVLQFINYR